MKERETRNNGTLSLVKYFLLGIVLIAPRQFKTKSRKAIDTKIGNCMVSNLKNHVESKFMELQKAFHLRF